MDVPGGNMLQNEQQERKQMEERVRELRKQRQEEREQEHQRQQQGLQDFFARQEAASYQDKDTRKEDEIRKVLGNIIQNQKDVQENVRIENFDRTSAKYMSIKDHTEFLDNQTKLAVKDKKWYNLFKGDSQEMTYVKQSLNFLNNLLDSAQEGAHAREQVKEAYRRVLTACEGYIYSHPAPKHSTGMRRLAQVKQTLAMMREEQVYLTIALDNVLVGKLGEKVSLRDTIASVREKKAKVSLYSKEGNSSDVYRVTLVDDEGKPYVVYLKKDEKLLNDDFPGFLDRRIEQLQRSQTNKKAFWEANGINSEEAYTAKLKELEDKIDGHEKTLANKEASVQEKDQAADEITKIRSTQEELRLAAGHLDDTDYDFANRFLQKMKDTIDELPDEKEKKEKIDRYLKFLGHDFDEVFKQLEAFNSEAQRLSADREGLEEKRDHYKAVADKGGSGTEIAKALAIAYDKLLKEPQKTHKSEYEWIEENAELFGLSKAEDAELLNLLKELSESKSGKEQHDVHRVSRLFLRSLGKEAELYGQQCDRSGLADTAEDLASNNTATARLADFCGMNDIVARSWKEMMTFQEFGKTEKTTALCTVSEVAEGEEMMSIVQQAEEIQKKQGLKKSIIHYSPNAMRQMMRLQMFDTLCLQTDRHWRNFKCQVKRYNTQNPPVWVIESLKSYDHDQSFGPKNLTTFFSDKNAKGFISPLLAKVNKSDPYYTYLIKNVTKEKDDRFISKIPSPVARGEFAEQLKQYQKRVEEQPEDVSDYERLLDVTEAVGGWLMLSGAAMYSNRAGTIMPEFEGILEAADKANAKETEEEKNKEGKKEQEKRRNRFNDPEKVEDIRTASDVVEQSILLYNAVKHLIDQKVVTEDGRKEVDYTPLRRVDRRKDETDGKLSVTDLVRKLRKLVEVYETVDLTTIETTYMDKEKTKLYNTRIRFADSGSLGKIMQGKDKKSGTTDYLVQSVLYFAKSVLSSNEEVMAAFYEEEAADEMEKLKEEYRAKGENLTDQELAEKAKEYGIGQTEIEVPTMLHMDLESYESVKRVVDEWEKVENRLLDLGWSQEKRLALLNRAKEILEQTKIAQEKAERYFKQMNLEGAHAKFFLSEEDYKEFSDITEIAPNPSMSYFSAEDPSYLLGEENFSELLQDSQKQQYIDNTNAMRGHVRQRLEKLEKGQYRQLVNGHVITPAVRTKLEQGKTMEQALEEIKKEQEASKKAKESKKPEEPKPEAPKPEAPKPEA